VRYFSATGKHVIFLSHVYRISCLSPGEAGLVFFKKKKKNLKDLRRKKERAESKL